MIRLDENTPTEQTNLKYFIVKFLGADINMVVNMIQIDKELKAKIVLPKISNQGNQHGWWT